MRTDMNRLDATIERFKHNAEYQRTHGDLHGCLEFRQLAEWLDSYKKILETSEGKPERKTGKWILKPSPDKYHCGYVICPFCNGEYVETDEYNFCPNCGADMRGNQE